MDPAKKAKFPEEKLAEMQLLISQGKAAEQILRSPIWGHIFTNIREVYVAEVVQAKEVQEVMAAKAKLTALLDLQAVLEAVFMKAKHAAQRTDETPARDVGPRKRVQR